MSKHVGIVGCSAEGAALCYRTFCSEASQYMGEHQHPEVSMHTFSLANYMVHVRASDWLGVASLMISSVRKLADMGAEFAICPDNTIHEAFNFVIDDSPIPWLHIANEVGREAKLSGYKCLGITGTQYLMNGTVYSQSLSNLGIAVRIPEENEQEKINAIIFNELVNGIIKEESRNYFNSIFQNFKNNGCDAVVLGCTEIPLLVNPDNNPLPVLDSTRILARAALKESIK